MGNPFWSTCSTSEHIRDREIVRSVAAKHATRPNPLQRHPCEAPLTWQLPPRLNVRVAQ